MPFRKSRIPILSGGTVKLGRIIGPGDSNEARRVTLKERTGKTRRLVTRRRKTLFPSKEKEIDYQQKIVDLRKAGLPVPWYSKVDLREGSPTFLHVFQPDLERRYGKLTPVNNMGFELRGKPTFLIQLTLAKDRKLIAQLGEDVARMHGAGYVAFWIDFWHFYKKENSWGRLIVDVDELYKVKPADNASNLVINMFYEFQHYFRPEEFQYFVKSYLKNCKNPSLAKFVEDHYVPKPLDYYSRKEYMKRERAAAKEKAKQAAQQDR